MPFFKDFGMTRPGIEFQISRTIGECIIVLMKDCCLNTKYRHFIYLLDKKKKKRTKNKNNQNKQ